MQKTVLQIVELYPYIEYMKFLLPGSITLAIFMSVMIGGGMLYIDDKAARRVEQGFELGIAEERELAGTGVFKAGGAGDLEGPVTVETALQLRSQITESQGGGSISCAPEGDALHERGQIVEPQPRRDLAQQVRPLRGGAIPWPRADPRAARSAWTSTRRDRAVAGAAPGEIVSDDPERES